MKFTRLVSVAAICMLLAGACGEDGGSSDNNATGAAEEQPSVGVVFIYANPFATGVEKGVRSVADAEGATVQFANPNGDAQLEAQAVQDFISKGVDALLYAPLDPEGSIANAKAASDEDIPVFCFDSCLSDEGQDQYIDGFVTSDNKELGSIAGSLAADYISANMDGKAKIGLLTCETIDICKLRREGIDEALAGLDVEIVASQEAFIPDKAEPAASNMLTANPDIEMIIAENQGGLVGAAAAVRTQNLDIPVFGIDMDPEIGQLLLAEDNIVQGTAGQDTVAIGEAAMTMALDHLNGEEAGSEPLLIAPVGYSRDDPSAIEEFVQEFGG